MKAVLKLTPGSKAYEEFCLKAFEKSGIEDNLISSIPQDVLHGLV